jgi:hypothetical protein
MFLLLPLHKGLVACPKALFLMHMIPPWISLNLSIHPRWYLLLVCCSFLLPSELQSLVSSKHCILKQLRTKHLPKRFQVSFHSIFPVFKIPSIKWWNPIWNVVFHFCIGSSFQWLNCTEGNPL